VETRGASAKQAPEPQKRAPDKKQTPRKKIL
jgi:hypothetical protein